MNSLLQVAQDLVEIHKEILVGNVYLTYEKLKAAAPTKHAVRSPDESDDGMEIEEPKPSKKVEPIIDEDGFELVVRKGKKK